MKTFFKNLKGGLTFGLGFLIMIIVGGFVFASLSNVEEGDILSAQKWNELVGSVNDLNDENELINNEIENLTNQNNSANSNITSLNTEIETLSTKIENLENQNISLNSVIPQGATIAFNSSTCPSGWLPANGSNGTPDLRGRFIRGLGGSENGEDEARTLGSYQTDQMRPIKGEMNSLRTIRGVTATGVLSVNNQNHGGYTAGWSSGSSFGYISYIINSAFLGENFDGSDTHPKNIALIYCVKA